MFWGLGCGDFWEAIFLPTMGLMKIFQFLLKPEQKNFLVEKMVSYRILLYLSLDQQRKIFLILRKKGAPKFKKTNG